VPFLDLRGSAGADQPTDLRRRLDAVLAHCQFILGPEVAELEGRTRAVLRRETLRVGQRRALTRCKSL
jgi:hypothetical protein